MGAPARSWDHPRRRYEEELSPAARRSAARAASRARDEWTPRYQTVARAETRPPLRVVRRPQARIGSILVIAVFLGLALAAPVAINLAVVRAQWQIAELRVRQDDVAAERSSLRAEHAALSSTQRVKETADRLGMVTPAQVGFIHLDAVDGTPETAVGGDTGGASSTATSDPEAGSSAIIVASTAREDATGR